MSYRRVVCGIRTVLIALVIVGISGVLFAGEMEWTSFGPEGAAVWSVKIDPQAPATMYVAAQGVWKSIDGGSSWFAASQGMPSERIHTLAIDPVHHETVYAGTDWAGVFKSIDGGGSWSAVNNGLPEYRVYALAVHPTTPSTVYVGLRNGGVHRSLDGGAVWASLNNGISSNLTVVDLAIDLSSPDTIYAGSWDGLFKTTDGGASWEDLGDLLPNHAAQCVAIDPTNSATVYVGMEGGGVYKSTDAGASWQNVSTGLTNLYIEAIVIDPSTPTTVYVATGGDGAFKSTDGGGSWVAMNDGMPVGSVYDLCLHPSDPSNIFAGAHGAGVFESSDGAASWASANAGLHAAWAEALVADLGMPGSVRAGTGNGVWLSTDGATSWQSANGDLTLLSVSTLARDPGDGDTMFAGTWDGVFKTVDGGSTWVHRDEGLGSVNVEMVATDPVLSDRVYVGVRNGLHISTDGGEHWSQPETGPQGKRVLSIAFDPAQPSTMYVGAWGGVYRSDDSGETWTSSQDEERIWDVAVDPAMTSTLYTCSYNGVFKSTNGGGDWTAASSGLTEDYCWALAVDPSNPETIYMGSGAGVFVSHDGAANWERFPGVDDFNIMDLAFDASGSTLYAALRGGGVAAYSFGTGGPCTLQCSASVPASATIGEAVRFQGNATATGCSVPPSYRWDFGDVSGEASGRNAIHRFGAVGKYSWTMTATADDVSCISRGNIEVTPFEPTWFVPAIAHAPGAAGTSWRTDVTVVCGDLGEADLELSFVPYEGGPPSVRQHNLAAGQTEEWQDVLVTLFGLGEGAVAKGTLRVDTDAPVFITARTYNQTSSGTYGQHIPALSSGGSQIGLSQPGFKALESGEVWVVPGLKKNADFRSNLGAQNLGDAAVDVAITLHGEDGGQIGQVLTETVGAGQYWQQDNILAAVGAGTTGLAYAEVEVVSAGSSAWFYGSVVDNATGDPTTVPAGPPGDGDALTGGFAHAPGAVGTTWRTDLAFVNLSGEPADLDLEFASYNEGPVTQVEVTLESGETRQWQDVLVSLFAAETDQATKGTLRVSDVSGLCINARTYNQTATGSFGQLMPAVWPSQGFAQGDIVVIPALKKNRAFRSNVGALNLSSFPVTVDVTLLDASGEQIGDMVSRTIPAHEYGQIDDVFGTANAGNCDLGYALLDVRSAGGNVWAYGSVIDNATGDPTTIPALGY